MTNFFVGNTFIISHLDKKSFIYKPLKQSVSRETFCFNKDNEQSFNHSESEVFFYLGLKENKIEQINLKMLAH